MSAPLDPRTPVLVGAGQVTNRGDRLVDPLILMEEAARLALADSGAAVGARLQSVQVVNLLSWSYPAPADALARRLGLPDGERLSTTIGGNTPQWLMARACDAIASGAVDGILIAGAETMDSAKRAREEGVAAYGGAQGGEATETVVGDGRSGIGPAELAAGLMAPAALYPLFESALAARAGRSPDEQRAFLGRLLAPMTEVAAALPELAWFPEVRSAEEISTVTTDNRLVGEPYTKRMNSIIQVDQGAALLLLSAGAAEAAGVARDRWVFPWSAAECNDVFLPSERPDVSRSPGIAAAARAALAAAWRGIDDVALLDLYSCFPCAMQMSAEALGIDVFDARGLTVTGAMPYFGGPGNNYVTHSIAVMADRCRQAPDAIGLVSGLGWYVTKHAVGLYSASPPPQGWRHADCSAEQAAIDATAVPVAADASGPAVVEAMTVVHDRRSGPASAPVFARLGDGRRVVAVAADPALPAAVSGTSLVGATVRVAPGEGAPRYEPI
jgi:acetyl-CoA C-acetyltransferase